MTFNFMWYHNPWMFHYCQAGYISGQGAYLAD